MNKLFFQLEPYIYTKKVGSSFLFYNEINNKKILLENISDVYTLSVLKKVFDPRNNGIVSLNSNEVENNPTISNFIDKAREYNIGYLLTCKKKPIQIPSLFQLPNDIHLGKMTDTDRSKDVMRNLRELTLYVNENGYFLNGLNNAYRQFLFPINDGKNEISLQAIEGICSEIIGLDYIKMINILGGNVSRHPNIYEIIMYFNKLTCRKTYHFVFNQEIHQEISLINFILNNKSNHLMIYFLNIDNYIMQYYDEVVNFIKEEDVSRVTFCNIISTENEIKFLNTDTSKYNKQNVRLIPYFDGYNISFFKRNVFINKRDILSSKYNIENLIANRNINSSFFGRLIIDPQGNVFSNINKKAIGNTVKDSLHKIVYSEIRKGSTWFLTRQNVSPCNTCIFNELCPPVSNYELYFNRFNLCKIVKP